MGTRLLLALFLLVNQAKVTNKVATLTNPPTRTFSKGYLTDTLPFQSAIAAALLHYPELQHTSIQFKLTGQESTGKTTMGFLSLFHKRNRHYIIKINNELSRTGVLLQNLTFEEQEGVLGHELAHIIDFSHRNFFGMMDFGINYLNKSKRRKLERATDLSTINHGLAKELFQWSSFVLRSPLITPAYKRMRKRFYLSPEEIKNLSYLHQSELH